MTSIAAPLLEARRRERVFRDTAPNGTRDATFRALAHDHDVVVVESGLGDGGYPVTFGVDKNGVPAMLLVDFLVLAEENGAGYRN